MQCKDCANFHTTTSPMGKCKYNEAERHVVQTDTHSVEVLNGWPVVNGTEDACRNFEAG